MRSQLSFLIGALVFSSVAFAADQVIEKQEVFASPMDGFCHTKILDGGNSSNIKVSNQSESSIDERKAVQVVQVIRDHYGCSSGELMIKNVVCMQGLDSVFDTNVCRVNHEEGYFLILQDYVGGFNAIFNRWD